MSDLVLRTFVENSLFALYINRTTAIEVVNTTTTTKNKCIIQIEGTHTPLIIKFYTFISSKAICGFVALLQSSCQFRFSFTNFCVHYCFVHAYYIITLCLLQADNSLRNSPHFSEGMVYLSPKLSYSRKPA